MTAEPSRSVTALLIELKSGNRHALARLTELIYPELRKLAQHQLRQERAYHVLQPTALVSEAYLRLVAHDGHDWRNRAHFFGAASQIMRRILVDHARARKAAKRNHGRSAEPLDSPLGSALDGPLAAPLDHRDTAATQRGIDLLALDEALHALERISPRQARIVQLRYFTGLSVRDVAEALGVTPRTVDRDWAAARAWLRRRLGA